MLRPHFILVMWFQFTIAKYNRYGLFVIDFWRMPPSISQSVANKRHINIFSVLCIAYNIKVCLKFCVVGWSEFSVGSIRIWSIFLCYLKQGEQRTVRGSEIVDNCRWPLALRKEISLLPIHCWFLVTFSICFEVPLNVNEIIGGELSSEFLYVDKCALGRLRIVHLHRMSLKWIGRLEPISSSSLPL